MGRLWNNKDMIPGLVSTIALAVVVVIALLQIRGLGDELEDHKEQLEIMTERGANAEQRNRELAGDLVEMQREMKELESQADIIEDIKKDLENRADLLENSRKELAADLDELERQNGELLKKFDGLSRPR